MRKESRIRLVDHRELVTILEGGLANEDRREGIALVDVSPTDEFERGHVPSALSIPEARAEDFERRFDRCKRICLYGARFVSEPEGLAWELAERGFSEVLCYPGGVDEWKESGHDVATGAACPMIEMDIA